MVTMACALTDVDRTEAQTVAAVRRADTRTADGQMLQCVGRRLK